ncbi:MAG: hypothetical protein J5I92_15080 [Thiogranum sp.]|nr:hypothetical protein [Thiogranum sp.]
MLNLLAQSRGYRNFPAYQASVPEEQVSKDRLVALEVRPTTVTEICSRDADGNILDRRHQQVEQIQFSMNVRIDIGHASTEVVVHAIGLGASWSFPPEYRPDERRIVKSALLAFGDTLTSGPVDLFRVHEVEVIASKVGVEDDNSYDNQVEVVHLTPSQFAVLDEAVAQTNSATTQSKKVIQLLREIARGPDWARQNVTVTRQALDYLLAIVECSGNRFMDSWNREKSKGIYDVMMDWTNGRVNDRHDDYAFRNLYSFAAPISWTKPPPDISPELAAVI